MKTTNIILRISESEKAHIAAEAKKRDIPMSQLIREAVRAYMSQKTTSVDDRV